MEITIEKTRSFFFLIDKYISNRKLEYFITDNAFSYNTFVSKIFDLIQLHLNLRECKLRYIKPKINLVAKSSS